jgi:hypothetical protein
MKQVILSVVLSVLLAACSNSPTLSPIASNQAASNTTTDPPLTSNAQDPCAGATLHGARESFTFAKIVPCLDTPDQVVAFMRNNLKYDGGWDNRHFGDNTYTPASVVYENGADDCDGLAEFAACVLSKNGYKSYNVGISILGPLGHNVAGYIGNDNQIYSISNGQWIDGPFNSWEDLAQFYINERSAKPNGVIWLFEPCLEKQVTGDPVINLPHTIVR